eukprot:TRINITY_DN9696_c1_g1_i2.p1 TRINITY_DN9696_c1_g1~~TRINITY_DN9696_c1_g1_i2.p1  ORF type:complete len:216 (+),score=20.37 TRINITY_DN9696_c1_g1_i2:113-760(+)
MYLEPVKIQKEERAASGTFSGVNSILTANKRAIFERECTKEFYEAILEGHRRTPRMVIQLYGIRHCGKTTLIISVIQRLCKTIEENLIYYFDFGYSKIRTRGDLQTLLENLVKEGKRYLFLDEIQYVTDWEFVLRFFEVYAPTVQFIVSGSDASAFLYSPLLTGRHEDTLLTPYSFKEFAHVWDLSSRVLPRCTLFDMYLKWGGFPVVVNSLIDV